MLGPAVPTVAPALVSRAQEEEDSATTICGTWAISSPLWAQRLSLPHPVVFKVSSRTFGVLQSPLGSVLLIQPGQLYSILSTGFYVGIHWKKRLCGRKTRLKPLMSSHAFAGRCQGLSSQHCSGIPGDSWENQSGAGGAGEWRKETACREAVAHSPCWLCLQ